jgi:hypothetical protein
VSVAFEFSPTLTSKAVTFTRYPKGLMAGISGGVGHVKELMILSDVNRKFTIQATITSSSPIRFSCVDREY